METVRNGVREKPGRILSGNVLWLSIVSLHPWQVWLLFFSYGLFYGLTDAPEKALIAGEARPRQRGAAFGA